MFTAHDSVPRDDQIPELRYLREIQDPELRAQTERALRDGARYELMVANPATDPQRRKMAERGALECRAEAERLFEIARAKRPY